MVEMLKDIRLIDRQGWLVFAMCVVGQVFLVIAALSDLATTAVFSLGILGVLWCGLLQLIRGNLHATLEVAKEAHASWHSEHDFAQEIVDDYVQTIHDLSRFDPQISGIHLERLRTLMIKRYPEMEDEIAHVQHPLNMPGIVI